MSTGKTAKNTTVSMKLIMIAKLLYAKDRSGLAKSKIVEQALEEYFTRHPACLDGFIEHLELEKLK